MHTHTHTHIHTQRHTIWSWNSPSMSSSSWGSSKTSKSLTTFGWSNFFKMAISLLTSSRGPFCLTCFMPGLGRPVGWLWTDESLFPSLSLSLSPLSLPLPSQSYMKFRGLILNPKIKLGIPLSTRSL